MSGRVTTETGNDLVVDSRSRQQIWRSFIRIVHRFSATRRLLLKMFLFNSSIVFKRSLYSMTCSFRLNSLNSGLNTRTYNMATVVWDQVLACVQFCIFRQELFAHSTCIAYFTSNKRSNKKSSLDKKSLLKNYMDLG